MAKTWQKVKEIALSKPVVQAEEQLARVVLRQLVASGLLGAGIATLIETFLR